MWISSSIIVCEKGAGASDAVAAQGGAREQGGGGEGSRGEATGKHERRKSLAGAQPSKQTRREQRQAASARDAENVQTIMKLRSKISMKAFEAERVALSFEERMALVRELKVENAMLKRKLEVLREDFERLEALWRM